MTDDESGAIPDPSSFHAIESMRVLHRQLMRNSHENQDPSTNKRGILQMKLLEVSVFVTKVQGNNVPNISIFPSPIQYSDIMARGKSYAVDGRLQRSGQ